MPEARKLIAREFARLLRSIRIRKVFTAERGEAPPTLAHLTPFARLAVPLSGTHSMDIVQSGQSCRIGPTRGQAVFVPSNCWNYPHWSQSVEVLTLLFGTRQIGISLVQHDGKRQAPSGAVKTNLHGTFGGVPGHLVEALTATIGRPRTGRLLRAVTESLLHAVHAFLESEPVQHRKAQTTYATICLYVQESFAKPLTRENVAEHFGLSPNHVSRLFRQEGGGTFSEYLSRVRIERAKFMLQEYDDTLKEVAIRCGYQDVHYFCRVFRRAVQMTPTTYRADSRAARSAQAQ